MSAPDSNSTACPSWQREFPIKQAEEFTVSRRGFGAMCCGAAVLGSAGLTIAAVISDEKEVPWFTACALDDLALGSDRVVYSPSGEGILIVRLQTGDLRAYSQQCTHLLCPVHYDAEKDHVFCPCHHGVFDVQSGKPMAGPPRRALPRFNIEVQDGMILVGTGEMKAEA